MIDSGLLISIAACVLAVLAVDRLHSAGMPRSSWFDLAFLPGLSGLVAGRLVTMATEDPAGLARLRGLLILRGGAELWPGVAVSLTALAVRAYRGGPSFWPTAQRLAPLALAAWGAYEAACPARGACPGPRSPLGLTPTGMLHRQLPGPSRTSERKLALSPPVPDRRVVGLGIRDRLAPVRGSGRLPTV